MDSTTKRHKETAVHGDTGVRICKRVPTSVKKSQFAQHIQMTVSYTLQPTETRLYTTHMALMVMGVEVYYKYVCLQWWHHMVRRRYGR